LKNKQRRKLENDVELQSISKPIHNFLKGEGSKTFDREKTFETGTIEDFNESFLA